MVMRTCWNLFSPASFRCLQPAAVSHPSESGQRPWGGMMPKYVEVVEQSPECLVGFVLILRVNQIVALLGVQPSMWWDRDKVMLWYGTALWVQSSLYHDTCDLSYLLHRDPEFIKDQNQGSAFNPRDLCRGYGVIDAIQETGEAG